MRFTIRSLIKAAIWLFLITAAVGVWSSYIPVWSLRFFLLTLVSGALFFFLGKVSTRHLWKVPPILSVYGIILASFFLLTQDWQQFNADVDLINVVGSWWMAIRPDLPLSPPHPNMIAGALSIILPLDLVWLVRERNRKNRLQLIVALMIIGFLTFGLWLTSSRGAWFSLLAALILGAGIARIGDVSRTRKLNKNLLLVAFILVCIVASGIVVAGAARLFNEEDISADENSLGSRITLYRNSIDLVKEQWLIGGGLGSFSGLYSSYILLLPVPMFFYSHNLYLDIWIEQGVFGLIAWLIILAGSILFCVRYLFSRDGSEQDSRLLSAGILASLCALSIHGLIDNPLNAEWGRSLLFVLPGLALAVTGIDRLKVQTNQISIINTNPKQKNFAIIALLVIFATMLWFNKAIWSAWNTNIGSILMAKTQLFDWPSGKWPEKSMGEQLAPVKTYFEKSRQIQVSNSTSNYRLGLIDFYGQNFLSAEQYLEQAYQFNKHHRGIQKALGYTYVWLGDFDQASQLLSSIPEAEEELDVYTWWWTTQDRSDLAENADKMLAQIDRDSISSTGDE
jgi:hypothetical protein